MTANSRRVASRILVVAAAASVALALGACSSGGSESAAGKPLPASSSKPAPTQAAPASTATSCTVVTQANVSTALGETVRAPVQGKATVEGGIACVYYGTSVPIGDPDVPSADSVRVVLVTGADGTKWFNDYESKVHAVAISGLGDQAYWDGSASVSVLKGTSYLRISVIGKTGISEAAEKTLAATALPNM
jgi:hypothetical protein